MGKDRADPSSQCTATTHKNERCKRRAMVGSSTCYPHSFSRFKGVPWWRNGTVQFAISILLSLAYIVYSEATKPSLDDMVKALRQADTNSADNLKMRYPGGYVLFGTYYNHIVKPVSSRLRDDYLIDWQTAEVKFVSQDSIVLRIPDIEMNTNSFSGNNVTIIRKTKTGSVWLPFGGLPDRICIDILEDRIDGLIIVMGFVPDPEWKGSMEYLSF